MKYISNFWQRKKIYHELLTSGFFQSAGFSGADVGLGRLKFLLGALWKEVLVPPSLLLVVTTSSFWFFTILFLACKAAAANTEGSIAKNGCAWSYQRSLLNFTDMGCAFEVNLELCTSSSLCWCNRMVATRERISQLTQQTKEWCQF